MSGVISFRFARNNPREAHALEILETWRLKGYSVRYILAEALINLDNLGLESTTEAIHELNEAIGRINILLLQNRIGERAEITKPECDLARPDLNSNFIASIKGSIKPGVRRDEF